MKLSELKKLSETGTSDYDDDYVITIVNHFDALLAVAEEASEIGCICMDLMGDHSEQCRRISELVEKLEEIK